MFYDIVYSPLETFFLKKCQKNNHYVITGIGMLIHQAIPAFTAFYNKTSRAIKGIKKHLLK